MLNKNDVTIKSWPHQIKLANKLLEQYTWNEIKYAIDYYYSIGTPIYSLGYLTINNNMKHPISMYTTEKNITENSDSGKRNWTRIEQNSKAKCGT